MSAQGDLGRYVRLFLGEYLPRQRNASPRTVLGYRDAIKLLLRFAANWHRRSVAELSLPHLDRPTVLAFLESIEKERRNCVATRNHRLAAIRSLFRFVSFNAPEDIEQCAQILAIPLKHGEFHNVDYLTRDEINAVFLQLRVDTAVNRRDDALLRFMYNTGARVQEVIDVRANDLRLESSASVLLRGKGRKERLCPLWADTAARLRGVLADKAIEPAAALPVFTNRDERPLTRFGVRYILAKYVRFATTYCPTLARKSVHPHTMRHTTAMHLLQAGVDLNTIRCWLGHVSVTTTNRYVELDLEMKRRALGDVSPPPGSSGRAALHDSDLITWLESL